MSDKQLLGPAMAGQPSLTFGQISSYLLKLKKEKDENAEVNLTNICLNLLERVGKLSALAQELSKAENAYTDPTAMGVVNGMILSLNTLNGSIAGEKQLVHLPTEGFTLFNPVAVKTRPATYYLNKEEGGRYHMLSKVTMGMDPGEEGGDYTAYRNNKTGEVHVIKSTEFHDRFKTSTPKE